MLLIISYFCSMKTFSNSVRELRRHYVEMLSKIYDPEESNTIVMMLLEHYFAINRISIALNPDMCLNESELAKLDSSVSELMTNMPIQYVIGKTDFCDMTFEVNENVLIPRPETEELVSLILSTDNGQRSTDNRQQSTVNGQRITDTINILDVGTGSGCIAISLAKLIENSNVTAIDISEKALEVAKRNATLNGVDVDFIQADILSDFHISKKFDIIVSNPPYVCESEKNNMRANVLEFEPSTALFVDDNDPIVFYRHIINFAKENLTPHGVVWFEINENLGKETVELCKSYGFSNSLVIKDFLGKDRFVKSTR